MHKFGFVVRLVVALIILSLLVMGGIALFNMAWAQGYMAATAVGTNVAAAPLPAVPVPAVPPHFMMGAPFFMGFHLFPIIFLGLGAFFVLNLLLFPIFMIRMGRGCHTHMMPHGPMMGHFGPMDPMWKKRCEEFYAAYQQKQNEPPEKKDE